MHIAAAPMTQPPAATARRWKRLYRAVVAIILKDMGTSGPAATSKQQRQLAPAHSPLSPRGPRCRAFSLIELIVVIGVIAVLMAFLLPVLRVANESARTVRCSSQLRQMGQAIFGYAANNRGLTPPWGGAFHIDDSGSPLSRGWIAMLWRYSGVKADSPLYHCPAFPYDDATVTYFLTAHWEHLQVPEAHSVPLGRVRLASQFLLVAEATADRAYIPPFGTLNKPQDNTDKDDSGHRDLVFFGEPGGYNMHRNGNNVLFADGHVAIFKRHDPTALTYSPTAMQNWDEVTGE